MTTYAGWKIWTHFRAMRAATPKPWLGEVVEEGRRKAAAETARAELVVALLVRFPGATIEVVPDWGEAPMGRARPWSGIETPFGAICGDDLVVELDDIVEAVLDRCRSGA